MQNPGESSYAVYLNFKHINSTTSANPWTDEILFQSKKTTHEDEFGAAGWGRVGFPVLRIGKLHIEMQSVGCRIMERKEITGPATESSPQVSEMTNVESDGTSGEEEGSNNPIDVPKLRRRRVSGPRFKSIDSRNLLEDIVDSPINGKDQTTVAQPTNFSAMDHSRVQFTLRASSHAHRKIRESPLSSDAIFHQARHLNQGIPSLLLLLSTNRFLKIKPLTNVA